MIMNRGLMFAALNATNEAILRSKSSSELYQKVCDAAVQGGHIRITAALLPNASKSLEVVAATSETGFIPQISISVDATGRQRMSLRRSDTVQLLGGGREVTSRTSKLGI
jgi:hypothetical protein